MTQIAISNLIDDVATMKTEVEGNDDDHKFDKIVLLIYEARIGL